jgi:hypothetical protein
MAQNDVDSDDTRRKMGVTRREENAQQMLSTTACTSRNQRL